MRWQPVIAAIALAGCGTSPARQGRIVSTNPCGDALLLALVPPERVGAISHYSHDPNATSLPLEIARALPATAGTAEEVIALKPSLVLADSFTPPATRAAYDRVGLRVLALGSPTTVAASIEQVREIAAAVGAVDQGRRLIAAIERAAAPQPASGKSALLYIGGDLANGSGTLLDELMRRAGLRNAAAEYGLAATGRLPVEALIARPPGTILSPGLGGRTAALRARVLARMGAKTVERRFDRRLINCGGPTIIPAMARLKEIAARSPFVSSEVEKQKLARAGRASRLRSKRAGWEV